MERDYQDASMFNHELRHYRVRSRNPSKNSRLVYRLLHPHLSHRVLLPGAAEKTSHCPALNTKITRDPPGTLPR